MRLFKVQRAMPLAAAILLSAFTATPDAVALPAGADSVAIDANVRQLVERIDEEQARNGPYSAELIDAFQALVPLYQAGGDRALATAALERTLQLVRANYGIHSLDQAPLIWQLVADEEHRRNFPAAWALEQELLDLARRNPDDLRTAQVLRQIGDKRMDILGRYAEGKEFPPQIVLGCYYDAGTPMTAGETKDCHAGNRDVVIRSLLQEAQRDYWAAIGILVRQQLYSSDDLRELEMDLVRSSYQYSTPRTGADSLRRLAAYAVATSEPSLNQIDALVQLADWYLIFGTPRPVTAGRDLRDAHELYKNAYQHLENEGVDEALIERIFSPQKPVVLPTFVPDPLAPAGPRSSTRFIDVAFDVTKSGEAKRVEILDTTRYATKEAKQRLVQLIKRSTFRPRIIGGEFVDSTRFTVRYYLNDLMTSQEGIQRAGAPRTRPE